MLTRIAQTKAKLLLILTALVALTIPTSTQIDNCCGIDRQCDTDEEWVSGYYAFQNNQCAAPSQPIQAQAQQQAQIRRSPPSINNCCFSGWQCDDNEEWISGYWAFQNDHCASQSHWEAQWRRQNGGGDAAGTASISKREPQAQAHQTSFNRRSESQGRRTEPAKPGEVICHDDACRWEHYWRFQTPWDQRAQIQPTISIKIDLNNPNMRLGYADDGTPVIVNPG